MGATMKDIAKRTGLGLATISSYLNGGNVREKNRIKIEEAIRELHFEVNEVARGLKTNRTKTIGIVIPELNNIFFAEIITEAEDILRSHGYDPIGLSTDDFFVNRKDTPKNEKGEYDYECIQAIDLELFNQTLQALLNKEEVELPEYDFVNGEKQFKGKKACLKENSILLIEGLHCLNDDLIPYIDAKYKFKIYLSPFIPLNVDRHNYISTLDLRLIRRIVRDNRTRGKKVDQTIAEWQIVRSGEEKYIFPYVYQADMIINTALAYEVGVLKIYAIPLLFSVGVDSEYYSESRRLVDYLQVFFTIPSEYVPKDSVLREFIG